MGGTLCSFRNVRCALSVPATRLKGARGPDAARILAAVLERRRAHPPCGVASRRERVSLPRWNVGASKWFPAQRSVLAAAL